MNKTDIVILSIITICTAIISFFLLSLYKNENQFQLININREYKIQ